MEPYKPNKMPFEFELTPHLYKLLGDAREVYGEYKGYLKSMEFDYKYLLEDMLMSDIFYSFKIDGCKYTKEDTFYFPYMNKTNDSIIFNNLKNVFMYGVTSFNESDISIEMFNKMNKMLLSGCKKDSLTKGSGHLRKKQTYILKPGIAGSSVSFIPPVYTDLNSYVKNLCDYINDSKDDSFISTALIHFQFQKLHPYVTANGKLGRILIPVLISSLKKEPPILYMSEALDNLKNTYFTLLSDEKDSIQQFIKLFLESIIYQCNSNIKKIKKLNKIYKKDYESFKTVIGGTTIYKVYPIMIKKIVFTTADIVNETGLHINSVNKVINKLVEAGYLHKEKKNGTNRVTFRYNNMFEVLSK